MDLKAVMFLVACFLLVNTKSSAIAPVAAAQGDNKRPPPPPPSPPLPKVAPPPPVKTTPPPPPPTVYKSPPPPPIYKAPPPPPPTRPPKTLQDCVPLCKVRCLKHSRKNICMRACSTCCLRCKCVPPGQYGNYEKCGKCYSAMTTRGGKLKCP